MVTFSGSSVVAMFAGEPLVEVTCAGTKGCDSVLHKGIMLAYNTTDVYVSCKFVIHNV